jgi:hypothetical protein
MEHDEGFDPPGPHRLEEALASILDALDRRGDLEGALVVIAGTQADATGGRIAGDPMALAGALENLERSAKRIPMKVNPAGAHLAIVNPLSSIRGGGMMRLFRTHPATEERVARLRDQASRGDY